MKARRGELGHWLWEDRLGPTAVAFVGRGPGDRREAARAAAAPSALAWGRQLHSDRVLEAEPGCAGEGDALVSRQPGLTLSVVTADCVPVLLSGGDRIAAVHAGWRGIAAGVVAAALDRLGPGAEVSAWIGPAIGPCCYEVGDEVAARFPDHGATTSWGSRSVDLAAAVRAQLAGLEVWAADVCTRCDGRYHSYRRDGTPYRQVGVAWLPGG